jgi:hypothetical protein
MPVNYRQFGNDPQISQQRGMKTLMSAMQIRQRQDIMRERNALAADRLRMQQEQNAWARPYLEADYERAAEIHPYDMAIKAETAANALRPPQPKYELKQNEDNEWLYMPTTPGYDPVPSGVIGKDKAPLVQMVGEKKYDETTGTNDATAFNTYMDLRDDAAQRMQKLRQAQQIFSGIASGAFAPGELVLKRFIQSSGIPLEKVGMDNNVSDMEAAEAISVELSMEQIKNTKGAISEKEMDLFLRTAPDLRKTRSGNALIIAMAQISTQYDLALSAAATQYAQRNGGRFSRLGFANSPERNRVRQQFVGQAGQIVGQAQALSQIGVGMPDLTNMSLEQLKAYRDQAARAQIPNTMMRAH